MVSWKYVAPVSSPWKPWQPYAGSSKDRVRSPKHFWFPFLLPMYHDGEVPTSIPTCKRKSNPSFSSKSRSAAHPSHAVTSETPNSMGRWVPTTSRQRCHFSQGKVWRKLCPPKAGRARSASTSVVWPPLVGSAHQDTEPHQPPGKQWRPYSRDKAYFHYHHGDYYLHAHTTYWPCTADSMSLDLYTHSPALTHRNPIKNS